VRRRSNLRNFCTDAIPWTCPDLLANTLPEPPAETKEAGTKPSPMTRQTPTCLSPPACSALPCLSVVEDRRWNSCCCRRRRRGGLFCVSFRSFGGAGGPAIWYPQLRESASPSSALGHQHTRNFREPSCPRFRVPISEAVSNVRSGKQTSSNDAWCWDCKAVTCRLRAERLGSAVTGRILLSGIDGVCGDGLGRAGHLAGGVALLGWPW